MKWVVACTLVVSVAVSVSIFYSTFFDHRFETTVRLWGHAPQQYIFSLLIFPFAAFAVFTALYLLVSSVGPHLQELSLAKQMVDNWIIVVYLVLILSSIVAITTYFSVAMSPDKLKPQFAIMYLASEESLREEFESLESKRVEEYRRQCIANAKQTCGELVFQSSEPVKLESDLAALPPAVRLQVLQSPKLQRELRLLEPPMQALTMLQMFITLSVGLLCLATIFVTWCAAESIGYNGANSPQIKVVINTLFVSVMAFAAFPPLLQSVPPSGRVPNWLRKLESV
ncbi:MAG: hypothetical protein IPH75_07980 [bacterium]|nr:hypothetical protein [bacterium]